MSLFTSLFFLAVENETALPYSPDCNLMELVWHLAKEYIANKLALPLSVCYVTS